MNNSTFSYAKLPKREVPCPICDGRKFRVLARTDRYAMGVSTVICLQCGLVMTNPMPIPEAMNEFYRHHYRKYYRGVETPSAEHIRKYGLDRRALHTVDYLVKRNLISPNTRVLDLGCGEGSILREIKHRFPKTEIVGIEPGMGSSEFARQYMGGEVYSDINELTLHPPFDLIIVNHVLEHLVQPVQFLLTLKNFLTLDGSMYVDVPDATVYRELSDLHIAHLYHFSLRSVAATVHKAGFAIADAERHTPPRHPPSIRCVVRLKCQELPLTQAELNDAGIASRIRSISKWAWYYHLRHTGIRKTLLDSVIKCGKRIQFGA